MSIFYNPKDENGFTIVELLVVIVVMGIVVISASDLFVSGFNLYSLNKDRAEIQRELRFITNYINENSKFTNNIKIVDSVTSTNLDSNKIALGEENGYFVIKTFNGSINTRNLSNIEISPVQFERNSEILTYTVSAINIDTNLGTKSILNNITNEDSTSGSYIIVDK